MQFTLTSNPEPRHLLVEAAGPMDLGDLCGMFDLAARICEMNGHRRLLLDLRRVQTDLSFTQHLLLGKHAAQSLARLERAASVVTAEQRRGTSELAAQNYGLRWQTFTDISLAKQWILE